MLKYAKQKRISFCTTCMNRLDFLKTTLPINIKENRNNNIEFVVLNYSSTDGLDDWIKSKSHYIKEGILNYYKLDGKQYFHMSHAKNVACKLGTGDIIVNLDADMFVGENFHKYLRKAFNEDKTTVTCGISGKIATTKKCFWDLKGYDERMMGWGAEDYDFVKRSEYLYGNRIITLYQPSLNKTIQHNNIVRTKNYESKFNEIEKTNEANLLLCCYNLYKKNITPNKESWGKAILLKNFTEVIQI